jgi:hypothetical protein
MLLDIFVASRGLLTPNLYSHVRSCQMCVPITRRRPHLRLKITARMEGEKQKQHSGVTEGCLYFANLDQCAKVQVPITLQVISKNLEPLGIGV